MQSLEISRRAFSRLGSLVRTVLSSVVTSPAHRRPIENLFFCSVRVKRACSFARSCCCRRCRSSFDSYAPLSALVIRLTFLKARLLNSPGCGRNPPCCLFLVRRLPCPVLLRPISKRMHQCRLLRLPPACLWLQVQCPLPPILIRRKPIPTRP